MAFKMTHDNFDSTFLVHALELANSEVPHELATYVNALKWAKESGIKTPQQLYQLNSIDELSVDMFATDCVIKLADGQSGKALMLIDKEPNNRFFDHVTLRSYGMKKLKEKLTQLYKSSFKDIDEQWLVEAREPGFLPSAVSPVSYSFYVFNGVVGLISQTDCNFAKRRISFFDGAFSPLASGKDVSLNTSELAQGNHLIPQHVARYLKLAQKLSFKTKEPFVAVQLFGTASGPVFAGFDFAPRTLLKNAVMLSPSVLKQLDDKLSGAKERLNNGSVDLVEGQQADNAVRISAALNAVSDSDIESVEDIPDWKYQRLLAVAERGEPRGAWRLSDKYKQLAEAAPNKLAGLINEQNSRAWNAIKQLNAGS